VEYRASYIFMCVGYYNYERGYEPDFKGMELFKGRTIHPQFWPKDFEYKDKQVVIIGSGATAVTLLPAMAKEAKHVTMLQRSPTYMGIRPAIDPVGNRIGKWFGRSIARWWFILHSMFIYFYCKTFPERAKDAMIGEIKTLLGDKFNSRDFTPDYNPWDQRVCLCPDGDFFQAMNEGKASVVTGHIDQITETGIQLKSGESLNADIIVTATGLEMLFLGGIEIVIDQQKLSPSERYVYKGFMCNGVPNMFNAVGYTNASWTLKVDLTNEYACRLINYMERNGYRYCSPELTDGIVKRPLLDLQSGYIQRGEADFPKQGDRAPWKLYQNYIYDRFSLKYSSLDDDAMVFYPTKVGA
jgi:cation diffusion facilitator CzcD-associated flavoprotein CzcO